MTLPTDSLAAYVTHARRRSAERNRLTGDRFDRAWEVARAVAQQLHANYHPARILAFGSLVHDGCFGPDSDIDLAIEGIPWPEYLHAWSEAESLSADFKVDLVDIGIVSDGMRRRIEAEGEPL